MRITPEIIRSHLARLPQRRSLDAALELFDALGYQYADELPLPTRDWPAGVRRLVNRNAEPPIYLAQHRDFRVVYTHLTTDGLSRTVERPIVEHTLHKLHPYALFVFANRDLTLWDFVNVKYVAEDGARRRTIRRIHVGPTERLHTAAQRMALLAVPAPDTSALELQSRHDQAFDVEEVTRQFYRDYVQVFGELCADIARRNPHREAEAEIEAQRLLDRLLFLYFIQKKGWLDDRREYLHQHFQDHYRADPDGSGFYGDFLFPLFVALSNEGAAFPSLGDVPFLNGGLFETPADVPLADQLAVGNGVFRQVFDDLLERYNFTVREDTPLDVEVAIDPEMLGQIFENLVLGLERGADRRKTTGSYYTPRVIVHFMCRQALKECLAAESGLDPARLEALMDVGPAEQLTPEEVAGLGETITEPQARLLRGLVEGARVLDPAVGSGAFLVGMLYEMVALTRLLDVRLRGQKWVRQRRNYGYDLKRGFIERNLYGVDIQPEAVRICELRLWLSLMVDYQRRPSEAVPTLPNLSYRVRVGDSLIERLFGEPVQLDQLTDDAVARQLIDRIQTEKRGYFKEPNLWEKQRRELRILGMLCELAAKLVGAKRGAVLTQMSAQVPQMGEAFLSRQHRKLKEAFEAELARYATLMEQVKGVYDQVQAMQSGEVPTEARDVDALRTQLGLSFIWRLDFAEVFADKGGFDVVIANPPYLGFQGHKADKDYLIDKFLSAKGRFDLYLPFIEQAVKLGREGAAGCYICPTNFMKRGHGDKLRQYLAQEVTIASVVDFGDFQIFQDALNYTGIFLWRRQKPSPEASIVYEKGKVESDRLVLKGFAYPQRNLGKEMWIFRDPPTEAIVEKIRAGRIEALGELTSGISEGIVTGKNPVFLKSKEEAQRLGLEAGILRDCLRGNNIRRYFTAPAGFVVLYPYRFEQGRTSPMPESELKRRFPTAYQYLVSRKGDLAGRGYFDRSSKLWFELWNQRDIRRLSSEKIVVPELAESNRFAIATSAEFYVDTACGIILRPGVKLDLKYVLGLLNSRLIEWFYKQTTVPKASGFYIYKTMFLKGVPIRTIDFDDSADVARHDNMVALGERMLVLNKEFRSADEADRAELEKQIAETDAEIDALVYELYGLTEGEIGVVEGQS